MNIKQRLVKLEQHHHQGLPTVGRVIVNLGETGDAALDKWLLENNGQTLPELLIVRVIVSTGNINRHR